MEGLPKYATGDVRSVPMTERYAVAVSKILERMTGEYSAPLYVAPGRYTVLRISGEKNVRG